MKHKIKTLSGHPLYVRRADLHVPGVSTEIDLSDAQLTALRADCRVLIGDAIDAMAEKLKAPRGKPRGNTPAPKVARRVLTAEEKQAPEFLTKDSDKPKRRRSKR